MSEWWNVNKIVQVWSGHAGSAQKKGKIYPPAGLEAIDEYQGSVEFIPADLLFDLDGHFDREDTEDQDASYPDFFVRLDDVTKDQYDPSEPDPGPGPDPDPDPDPVPVPGDVPSPTELGEAMFVLGKFIKWILGT